MAALFGLVDPAMSTDMPVPFYMAPPPVVPPSSWTGCYAGGHSGYLWGSDEWTNRTSGGAFDNQWLGGHRVINAFGGVQAGCDYQFAGGFVVGITGDHSGRMGSRASMPAGSSSASPTIAGPWRCRRPAAASVTAGVVSSAM
jgi:opacity protein-like surface antigen